MLPILVDSLIGVGADIPDPRDAKGAFAGEPVANDVARQRRTQCQPDGLMQPSLRDV